MADPMDELKQMILESIASNRAMHESTAVRMAADARATTEQIASFKADLTVKVQAVANGLSTIESRVVAVEKQSASAETTARAAMHSHDSLQVDLRAELGDVKVMLMAQNDDLARREAVKKDEREKESLANKRVQERREFRTKMATIWAPVAAVLFTTAVGAVVTISTQRAHDDTASRLERLSTNLTNRNLVSPSNQYQNYTAPAAAASPVAPSAPASKP